MMKIKSLLTLLLVATTTMLFAQQRYLDYVFTDAEIFDTTGITYGVGWNPYIDPALLGGQTQVQPLQLDIYMPSPAVDTETERPVVVYFHTGSFLPPSVTNGCTGTKEDSSAVTICRDLARRGYVAISATYRLGWLANSTNLDLRRGTNLVAVYFSIQDAKTLVRYLNLTDVAAGNPWGIEPSRTILLGQGSGGYTTFAYATIDNYAEVANPTKFQYQGSTGVFGQPVNPGDPYIDTALFGDWDGYGGQASIIGQNPIGLPIIDTSVYGRNITSHAGQPDDVLMVANMGGALGDSAWLEAGDVPMVSIHSRFDFFAPYVEGMVQVPVGGQFFPVVFVQGSHWAIERANALGNNTVFANAMYNDALWQKGINNQYNIGNVPGIYTINIQPDDPNMPWIHNSGPWDFWDPASTCVNAGNPNIKAQSKAYIDTVIDYLLPRFATVLNESGMSIGLDEVDLSQNEVKIFPNPASSTVTIQANQEGMKLESVEVLDITGKVVYNNAASSDLETRIDVNGWSAGMYIIRVKTSSGIGVQKITVR